jgi:SAM-dependent methyltransferase
MLSLPEVQHGADPSGFVLRGTLFLTALGTLLLEILLTRVLSVVMWYHFTFAVISVALLGIAAGALQCYRRFPPSGAGAGAAFGQAVGGGLNLFSVAVALPIGLMTFFIETPTFSFSGAVLLLAYFAACAAPFYASGYVTAVIFRFGSSCVSSLYAFDLLGGAMGCLLAIPLLNYLGGIRSLLLVSVLTAGASALLALRAQARQRSIWPLATVVIFLAVLSLHTWSGKLDLRTVKVGSREEVRPVLEVKWNSHSRLAMLDYFDPKEKSAFTFLAWGLSDLYQGWLPRQYLITIDGASETPVTELQGDIRDHEYLAWDITSLPYHLRPGGKTLVVGAGGGRDLLTALWFGSKEITGVELNQGIVDWVRGPYAEFAGRLYSRPEVRVVVDDGRNFVRAAPETFDVVQISMIDTFTATAAGAYTLSENNLYTVQAFEEYLDHLSDSGILSINRFFLDPPQQTLRIVTLAREALERRGVRAPARHIVVVRKRWAKGDNGLVMIKKTPFTELEAKQIQNLCATRAFEPVALPGEELENPFTAYLQEADPERFYKAYPFDVRPPTDNQPFFFNTFKVAAFADSLRLRDRIEPFRVYNFDAVFILFALLVLAAAALLLFVFVPLLRAGRGPAADRRPPRLPLRRLVYFICVGLGFILVEVVLIQRFHLYLGHPVYSLAVTLVSLLTFSGIGSAWTTRWAEGRFSRSVIVACGATLLLIVAHEGLWPFFLSRTLGMPLPARVALAALSLLPIGLSMGMPYPLGLRAVSGKHPDGLPWVWAVNAAASVLGSILAFALAMAVGFRVVLLLGGLCYAGALLSFWAFVRARPESTRAVSPLTLRTPVRRATPVVIQPAHRKT